MLLTLGSPSKDPLLGPLQLRCNSDFNDQMSTLPGPTPRTNEGNPQVQGLLKPSLPFPDSKVDAFPRNWHFLKRMQYLD